MGWQTLPLVLECDLHHGQVSAPYRHLSPGQLRETAACCEKPLRRTYRYHLSQCPSTTNMIRPELLDNLVRDYFCFYYGSEEMKLLSTPQAEQHARLPFVIHYSVSHQTK